MSGLTVGGAVRQLIVSWNLALAPTGTSASPVYNPAAVFRDQAPDATTYPFITFLDPISDGPTLAGDGRSMFFRRVMQVDVWQKNDPDAGLFESDSLLEQVVDGLDGARITANQATMTLKVADVQRVPDEQAFVVHHAITVSVAHGRGNQGAW